MDAEEVRRLIHGDADATPPPPASSPYDDSFVNEIINSFYDQGRLDGQHRTAGADSPYRGASESAGQRSYTVADLNAAIRSLDDAHRTLYASPASAGACDSAGLTERLKLFGVEVVQNQHLPEGVFYIVPSPHIFVGDLFDQEVFMTEGVPIPPGGYGDPSQAWRNPPAGTSQVSAFDAAVKAALGAVQGPGTTAARTFTTSSRHIHYTPPNPLWGTPEPERGLRETLPVVEGTEALVGWKRAAFSLDDPETIKLRGVIQDDYVYEREMVSDCRARYGNTLPEHHFDVDCCCGFYVGKTPESIGNYAEDGNCWLRCECYGEVLEGSLMYRAEKMRISAIHLDAPHRLVVDGKVRCQLCEDAEEPVLPVAAYVGLSRGFQFGDLAQGQIAPICRECFDRRPSFSRCALADLTAYFGIEVCWSTINAGIF